MQLPGILSALTVSLALLSGVAEAKLSADQHKALSMHNEARKDRGLKQKRGDLAWDDGLARDAFEYAKVLAKADGGLVHAKDRNNAGENLWMVSAGDGKHSFEKATRAFLDEKKDYMPGCRPIKTDNDADMKWFMGIGHYTQCVWPSTQKVGMAEAVSKSGKRFVVARYRPSGNMAGQSAC